MVQVIFTSFSIACVSVLTGSDGRDCYEVKRLCRGPENSDWRDDI